MLTNSTAIGSVLKVVSGLTHEHPYIIELVNGGSSEFADMLLSRSKNRVKLTLLGFSFWNTPYSCSDSTGFHISSNDELDYDTLPGYILVYHNGVRRK